MAAEGFHLDAEVRRLADEERQVAKLQTTVDDRVFRTARPRVDREGRWPTA